MKKVSLVSRSLFKLNLLAALGLLATYATPYIAPQTFWPAALVGLTYPFMLAINILFATLWLYRKKWHYLIFCLLVIISGSHLVKSSVAFNANKNPQKAVAVDKSVEKVDLKVLSYNVQNFDLYNWTENVESRNKIMKLIRKQDPDIIGFQEFYTEDGAKFNNINFLVSDLKYPHYHFEKTLSKNGKMHWGVAVFSKYPIAKKNVLKFANSKNNIVTYSDIKVQNQTIRFFNAHLQSIHLGRDDMKYVKTLGNGGSTDKEKPTTEEHIKSTRAIVKKLKAAFVKRGQQAKELAKVIAQSPHPVVVCGDFNDTPASYTYHTISKNLKDAFLEVGVGLGGTYAGPLPSFRIDYVLLDQKMNTISFEVIDETYTDHYPVTCEFSIPK